MAAKDELATFTYKYVQVVRGYFIKEFILLRGILFFQQM
jgi:hypothetical protein